MKKEQILAFTRRISQTNRGGSIVVTYDVFFAYLTDARESFAQKDWLAFKEDLRRAARVLEELMSALDFSKELAKDLYSIYVFCKESLARSMYKRKLEDLQTAERLMKKLYDAFTKAAAQDTSPPLMKNTQQVYAGYTYGKNDLVETCQDFNTSRGFFA